MQSMWWFYFAILLKMNENLGNMFQWKIYFALIMVTFNPNGSLQVFYNDALNAYDRQGWRQAKMFIDVQNSFADSQLCGPGGFLQSPKGA